MIELTDSNFNESIGSGKIVIDFWAEWCNPCKTFKKTMEDVSGMEEFSDVKFFSCDSESNEELIGKFSIRNLPTVVFINNGDVVGRSVGALSKQDFVDKLNEVF